MAAELEKLGLDASELADKFRAAGQTGIARRLDTYAILFDHEAQQAREDGIDTFATIIVPEEQLLPDPEFIRSEIVRALGEYKGKSLGEDLAKDLNERFGGQIPDTTPLAYLLAPTKGAIHSILSAKRYYSESSFAQGTIPTRDYAYELTKSDSRIVNSYNRSLSSVLGGNEIRTVGQLRTTSMDDLLETRNLGVLGANFVKLIVDNASIQ